MSDPEIEIVRTQLRPGARTLSDEWTVEIYQEVKVWPPPGSPKEDALVKELAQMLRDTIIQEES